MARRQSVVGVTALLLAGVLIGATAVTVKPPAAKQDGVSVWFSPKGGCTAAIVDAIDHATKTLDIQAYAFTSTDIAAAMTRAHDRGVKVRAVLDRKSNVTGKYSGATYIKNHGIPTYVDGKHAIAHNKIILIDGSVVITGSFNFSKAAEESNAENLLIITDRPKVSAAYAANFEEHLKHAEVYEGVKGDGKGTPTDPDDK